MRSVCRPGGRPARAKTPALSLTPNARAPRTATITPGMGRPLVDERAVPTIRAVVSRWACPGKRDAPTHRMSRLLSVAGFNTPEFTAGSGLRRSCTAERHLLLHHIPADPDHA